MKYFAALFLALLSAASLRADDLPAEVRAELNLARTAPQQYAEIVARHAQGRPYSEGDRVVKEAIRFLQKARPLPPLASSQGLSSSALAHVLDQGATGKVSHRGRDGSTPWKRMARFGQWSGRAAENIMYGRTDARSIVVDLIVDDNVRDRGHRLNIFGREFRYAGIATGMHARYGTMCVIDFAAAFREASEVVAERTPVTKFRF